MDNFPNVHFQDFFLHQDNDPKHCSGLVANYMQYNHIRWVKTF